jgi:preprotein translocase subunit SecA
LRAKGIDNESPELTYTGPAEDGSAQVQGNGGKTPAGVSGGTRRERREAARRQGRHSKPKSAKRR